MANNEFVTSYELIAKATDPIYIGTGGYTIGRVDNTIVRDPITKIPKIPGTSVAGTWRYFVALELQKWFIEEAGKQYRSKRSDREKKSMALLTPENAPDWVKKYDDNCWSGIKCAGQDDLPNEEVKKHNNDHRKNEHCGNCIVCKSFGYAKSDKAEQGLLSFTDLNILFFPVYTQRGTRWITSKSVLDDAGLIDDSTGGITIDHAYVDKDDKPEKDADHINLGWIYLPVSENKLNIDLSKLKDSSNMIKNNQLIIVPDELLSQIINSNLEVRTSVSIDPNTGAAKQGALFTSEAIPRATYFYGKVHIFQRLTTDLKVSMIKDALNASKKYYETLGIGGMTTRGFGRLVMNSLGFNKEDNSPKTDGGTNETRCKDK